MMDNKTHLASLQAGTAPMTAAKGYDQQAEAHQYDHRLGSHVGVSQHIVHAAIGAADQLLRTCDADIHRAEEELNHLLLQLSAKHNHLAVMRSQRDGYKQHVENLRGALKS